MAPESGTDRLDISGTIHFVLIGYAAAASVDGVAYCVHLTHIWGGSIDNKG